MNSLRVAVVGVGHHGRHHARNLARMEDVELVGVVDAHKETAQQVAEACHTRALATIDQIIDRIDAVCIAVPTVEHFAVASPFLSRGIATLIEKPLTFWPDQGKAIVQMARQNDATLMVGHIERFNPAWSAAIQSGMEPKFIESTRLSRYPFRSLDVSVVFDIMIHDIDLALSLTKSNVRSIQAVGGTVLSPSSDWAEVHLEFQNGAIANLSASRVHHATERRMRLASHCDSLEIDFLRRVTVHHQLNESSVKDCMSDLPPHMTQEAKESMLRQLFEVGCVTHDRDVEPLRSELEEFVAAAREKRDPLVTGEQALDAVCLADEIDRRIRRHAGIPGYRESA